MSQNKESIYTLVKNKITTHNKKKSCPKCGAPIKEYYLAIECIKCDWEVDLE